MPLEKFVRIKDNGGLKFQAVSQQEQKQIVQASQQVREFGNQRQQLEGKAEGESKANESNSGKLAKSPIVGKPAETAGKEASAKTAAPPAAPEIPKTDPNVTQKTAPGEAPANKTPTAPAGDSPGKSAPESRPKGTDREPVTGKEPNGREPAPKPEPKPEPKPQA